MDNLWLKVENIGVKGEITCFEQFLLLSLMFSKSRLLQRRQKASIWGKGLSPELIVFLFQDIRNFFGKASNKGPTNTESKYFNKEKSKQDVEKIKSKTGLQKESKDKKSKKEEKTRNDKKMKKHSEDEEIIIDDDDIDDFNVKRDTKTNGNKLKEQSKEKKGKQSEKKEKKETDKNGNKTKDSKNANKIKVCLHQTKVVNISV